MLKRNKLSRVALAVALSVGVSSAAMAQETSSSLTGVISDPAGNPAAGTEITIIHEPSGTKRTVLTSASGSFAAKGLRVGGPYKILLDSDKFEDKVVNDIYLKLGDASNLNISMEPEQGVERIVVSASALSVTEFGSSSPASHFDLSDIENAASADRDLKDIIRIDPRIQIAEADGEEAIICGGSNPRFSSLTLDGIRMNDSFGLNFNGYPTVRQPFSFDSIDQVSIELAPFDVQFGGFTACNINAVTKSGTNEVKGGAFYDYTNDSLTGDKIDGEDQDTGDFSIKRYGFNVGAPLIKDTLFFFTSYEKLEGAQIFQYDALGNQVSQEELDRAIQIAQDVYGYDAGGTPASAPVEDEKLLLKLDWNISDNHRASFVYNFNDGFRLDQSDDRNNSVTLDSHFYQVAGKMNSYAASLYSDWSDNFSTELRVGHITLDNTQESLDAASGFGEIQIERVNGATIFIGPDDSRQSNDLNWNNTTFKLAGTYYAGNHTITGGIERENLEVFNLFVQHTIGEYRFNGLDDFENGLADDVFYNNAAVTNNPLDAAANFEYATNAAYIQDQWVLDDIDLTLTFGLRYDWYQSSDRPRENELFRERFGFSNTETLDGKSLLQPRFGFNYRASENLEFRGGIGLYSGGNPNVWISNSYSNDGVTNIDTFRSDVNLLDPDLEISGEGRLIFDALQSQVDEVANNSPALGNEPSTNAIDPDFDIPSEWKYNIGLTFATKDDYLIQADILHTEQRDNAIIQAASWNNATRREALDGRAIYDFITVGVDEDGDPVSRNFRKSDLILSNATQEGRATTFSIAVKKEYESGLDMNLGYAHNKAKDVTPMTSSVSFSNFTNFATSDAQNPGLATSNYEVPHRFTFNLRYSTNLFADLRTSFSLFGSRTKGRPISYAFDRLTVGETEFRSRRHLIYVPTEGDDPIVNYADDFDLEGFNQFIEDAELTRGQIADRNSNNSAWYTRVDFRIDQELAAFSEGHRANAYLVIKNLGNLLNDEWGISRVGNFTAQNILEASLNDDGSYTYERFNRENLDQTVFLNQSLWQVRMGIRYSF